MSEEVYRFLHPTSEGAELKVPEITMDNSWDFQRAALEYFDKYILDNPAVNPVLDVSSLARIDTAGVASLAKLASRVNRRGLRIQVRGVNEQVRDQFDIAKLSRLDCLEFVD